MIYLVRGWFSWAFLVPPRSWGFRPSSGFSLLSFRCSSLRSLLPFRSRFLCCSLRILFPLGFSLSLPWPFFLSPVASSVCPCFWILLLRSMASSAMSFSLAAGSLVVWCPFCFSVRLPSSMRCFFVSFLSSSFLPSGCLFPSPLSLSSLSLRVSCFLLFPYFLLGSSSALLSVLSSGMFSRWAFPFLACSRFLVPPLLVFSLLTVGGAFVSALSQVVLFLLSRLGSSGSFPLGGVSFLWPFLGSWLRLVFSL